MRRLRIAAVVLSLVVVCGAIALLTLANPESARADLGGQLEELLASAGVSIDSVESWIGDRAGSHNKVRRRPRVGNGMDTCAD